MVVRVWLVAMDLAVADGDDAVRVFGDVALVGDEHDGVALLMKAVEQGHDFGVELLVGVELTHVAPTNIDRLAREAKALGAEVVVVHGETIVEPVAPGTNKSAAIILLSDGRRTTGVDTLEAAKMAAVGEMAAGIAHELNNPLTTISGFAELILEELPPDSTQRADLELIVREARRARDVVRRLLDFARQSESVRVPANVNELIEETLDLMKHLLHTSGIDVVRDFASPLPEIPLDRNQIKQVLLNLFHNALHAMPTGGRLSIRTQRRRRDSRSWVAIAIRDTGMGIAPEVIGRVFEPFFTTRAHEGGTGLGLSVSYGIVVNHGGDIEVESEVGKGSCFTVWLPVEVL